MARTLLILNNPTLVLADDEAGLALGEAFECQITSAAITPVPTTTTVPATGCAPATTSPGKTGYTLELAWLQDWNAPGGGLSNYAFVNDTLPKWFKLIADKNAAVAEQVVATGQAYVVAGALGGTFGDGSPAATTASWPMLDAPSITTPADVLAASAEAEDAELATSGRKSR